MIGEMVSVELVLGTGYPHGPSHQGRAMPTQTEYLDSRQDTSRIRLFSLENVSSAPCRGTWTSRHAAARLEAEEGGAGCVENPESWGWCSRGWLLGRICRFLTLSRTVVFASQCYI